MHTSTAAVHEGIRAYQAMTESDSARADSLRLTGLAAVQQRIRHTHLQGAVFTRLPNRTIELGRLAQLLKVVVWETLIDEGVDPDAAVLARTGEPGYGWTNGGWVLAGLEGELQKLFNQTRVNDGAFGRLLSRAIEARSCAD
jgi:hypothetical protein